MAANAPAGADSAGLEAHQLGGVEHEMDSADFLVVDHEFLLRIDLHQAPLGAGPTYQTLQEAAFFAPRSLCEQLDHDVPPSGGRAMGIDIDEIPRLIDRLHRASR